MIITKLEQQKKNTSRVNLYIDEQFFAGISTNTLAKFNLYKEKEISEEILQDVLYQDLKQRFTDRAVNYLTRAPKTVFQMRRYLNDLRFKKKGNWFDEGVDINFNEIFDEVIEKLEELLLLDDESYARMFIESRIKNKPRGKFVLISELMSKGVNKDIANKVCDELIEDEYDILKGAFYKKYKSHKLDITDRKKVAYLQRKCFSYDLIKQFIEDESRE